MRRDLLFMADYHADPIWDAATDSMVRLERLPISDDTRAAIRGWARRWEELSWQQMHADDVESGMRDGPAEPVPAYAWENIQTDGRALCHRLRRELGEGWRVGWVSFEDGKRHAKSEPDGPVELLLPTRWEERP